MIEEPPANWKTQLRQLKHTLVQKLSNQKWDKETLQKALQSFDPQPVIDWISKTFQKRSASFYGILATITLSTYFLADLTALMVGQYIPESASPRHARIGGGGHGRSKSINNYSIVFSRNLFNSKGIIPGDEGTATMGDPGGAPVKSSLPLNLIGTLIMEDELKSIATIEDKTSSIVYPMRIDDEIPNKIKIVKIEPRRAIFVNKAANRREYIELPDELLGLNPVLNLGRAGGPGIEKVAPTQFNVARTEVDRALADFNNILTQARAVPNFENGVSAGYKLFQIVPGSIYDKLGLQNGDVISGLNGQPINDPGKAFEMLSELKTANHLELQVKKDGKSLNYTYDIH